jgi:hypothetical protein
VALDDLDITIVDDDFSHVSGCTLPWAMRGWRDHPPGPAFLRAAPRKEATGAGLPAVAMQSLQPRLLSGRNSAPWRRR